ncbi:hypothetical protein AMJ57_02365 [Parcubacteria bacterium SG8_24]|nr:MAG: hypothetical protein AMJ57_02365 [Parcubacteria bacterium SG8_24]
MNGRRRTGIVYFGTSDFAVPPLEALLADPDLYEVRIVVTQPDRPAGRRQELKESPVAAVARGRVPQVLKPDSLTDPAFLETLQASEPDLLVVAAYGRIIPETLLRTARVAPLNLHASLLPAYRGASPIQAALVRGEKRTGVTLMVMDEKMDHGPVVAQAGVAVGPQDTFKSLEARLSQAAAELLVGSLPDFLAGRTEAVPQDHAQATYTRLLRRQDGLISWSRESAAQIERKVRAYDPWPGVHAPWSKDGRPSRLKLLEAAVAETASGDPPGTVKKTAEGLPSVATSEGDLLLRQVQPEGRAPMSGADFLRGHQELPGSRLPDPADNPLP